MYGAYPYSEQPFGVDPLLRLFSFPDQGTFNAASILGPNYKIYFYEVGTTTDKAVYGDLYQSVAHSNPVVLDRFGILPDIYLLTSEQYKIVVCNEKNVVVHTIDSYQYPWGDLKWKDITTEILVRGVAATDPSWTIIDSGPLYAYAFGVGDYIWMSYHVPHDIVQNSPIYFHAHWLPSGTDTNTVKWEWMYSYAKGFNQETFDTSGTAVTAEEAGPGVAFQHMTTETAAVALPGAEPDGIIHCRIGRVTNGGSDNSDTIFLLTADIHYQSTNIGTPGKAPDFYA